MEGLRDFDQSVLHAINQGLHSAPCDLIFWFFSSLGVGAVQLLLIAPLFALKTCRAFALQLVLVWAMSGGLIQLIKSQTVRLRPTNDPTTIVTPGELIFKSSFPSGHTATSFAIALVVLLLCPCERRKLFGFIVLSMAFLVGVSRVYRGVHWPTDVVGGALIGCACAFVVASFVNRKLEQAGA